MSISDIWKPSEITLPEGLSKEAYDRIEEEFVEEFVGKPDTEETHEEMIEFLMDRVIDELQKDSDKQ